MADKNATLKLPDGKSLEFPVLSGTTGPDVVDIRALYGKSDATGSSPYENPVHPTQMLATVYHTLGIDPHTMVLNHLNQPRELVQAEPVTGLFG